MYIIYIGIGAVYQSKYMEWIHILILFDFLFQIFLNNEFFNGFYVDGRSKMLLKMYPYTLFFLNTPNFWKNIKISKKNIGT